MYKNALKHFKTTDPILYKAALKLEPITIEKSTDYFASLCREIVGQQLAGAAARKIFERFVNLFPDKKLSIEFLLSIPEDKIREVGCSWAKVRSLKDLAQKVTDGTVDLKTIDDLDHEAVVLTLTKVKGIGPWTTEMFLMFALGREDVFSPGDLGLRNGIAKLYKLKEKPTPQEMLESSEKWKPYRTYASLILWNFLDNRPDK